MYIKAIRHIRRLRGGAQSQLMAADDGHDYVVKFQGNPQATRVLANDYLAGSLAGMIGLSVPTPAIIQVDSEIIREYKITFQLAGCEVAPPPGLHFGSRLIANEQVHDWLPISWMSNIRNVREFAGILAFDKWTANADGRQAVFHKRRSQRKYKVTFIDFGYCFNASEWSFIDYPLRGTYSRQEVYAHIRSWEDFEPWLSRIEHCFTASIQTIASELPREWYGQQEDLDQMLESLLVPRTRVRQLIEDFKNSHRSPFPNWSDGHVTRQIGMGNQLSEGGVRAAQNCSESQMHRLRI